MTDVSGSVELDRDEIAQIGKAFKRYGGKKSGQVTVEKAVECLEQMDFIFDCSAEELIRSIVPAASKTNSLDFYDLVKVAGAAKIRDAESGMEAEPQMLSIDKDRQDSLAELQASFNKQFDSGGIPDEFLGAASSYRRDSTDAELDTSSDQDEASEPERRSRRGIDRKDSLAELQASFNKQLAAGAIPDTILEGHPDSPGSTGSVSSPSRQAPPTQVAASALPVRRRSISKGSSLNSSAKDGLGSRRDSAGHMESEGPNPKLVDLPKKRHSLTSRSGAIGAQLTSAYRPGAKSPSSSRDSSPQPRLGRQGSVDELEYSAKQNLGTLQDGGKVSAWELPVRRPSLTVTQQNWFIEEREKDPFDGADVSYESIDQRGAPWWQCFACNIGNVRDAGDDDDNDSTDLDDDAAAVIRVAPEVWRRNHRANQRDDAESNKPGSSDVCAIM